MITGASRGIGLAIARAVLDAGHHVVATARRPDQLQDLLASYGERALVVALDITQPAQAESAVAAAIAKFGRIDLLVNNAGYGQIGWFENTSPEQIDQQFQTNVFGTMHVTRAVLPRMRHNGLDMSLLSRQLRGCWRSQDLPCTAPRSLPWKAGWRAWPKRSNHTGSAPR